jgi:hypothetical protein
MNIRSMIAARTANKEMERELATYTSASDRNDLDAILARHDEEQTAGIRRILAAQRESIVVASRRPVPAQPSG